jgi:anti-sigma factor RsiW
MKSDLYDKLVDLYAGGELPAELEDQMELAASSDPALARDMSSLRSIVDSLRNSEDPEFTEESYQRVLMKVYARGVDMQPQAPAPAHFQYHLPLQG